MNYNNFLSILKSRHLLVKGVACELEMSPNGLRDTLNNDTMKASTVRKLCTFLNITPNDFFGMAEGVANNGEYTNIGSVNASKNIDTSSAAFALMERQLNEKDKQIQEKDMQIRELHKTINNLTNILNHFFGS